jgi:hypothetical protein
VSEIYFIIEGTFGVAFNSFDCGDIDGELQRETPDENEIKAPEDMRKKGHTIGLSKKSFALIGDYYVLSSRPSQFHYVALS